MERSPSSPQRGHRARRVWPLLSAVLLYAALMAVRYELASVWLRAAAAGCAGASLGWGLWRVSRPRG